MTLAASTHRTSLRAVIGPASTCVLLSGYLMFPTRAATYLITWCRIAQHYSHIRLEAKRNALEALEAWRAEKAGSDESTDDMIQ